MFPDIGTMASEYSPTSSKNSLNKLRGTCAKNWWEHLFLNEKRHDYGTLTPFYQEYKNLPASTLAAIAASDAAAAAAAKAKRSRRPSLYHSMGVDMPDHGEDIPEHHREPEYLTSYTPNYKGCRLNLPVGATITVPESALKKKDVIKCHVTSPSQRWDYSPPVTLDERQLGEVYNLLLPTILKKPLILTLPYLTVDLTYHDIVIKAKLAGAESWVYMPTIKQDDTRVAEVEIDSSGSYVVFVIPQREKFEDDTRVAEVEIDSSGSYVVFVIPRREKFEVPIHGCLHSSRISRFVSARFPKKCADKPLNCYIQLEPVTEQKKELLNTLHPNHGPDIAHLSEIITLSCDADNLFRRSVTVKLPLPAGIDAEDEQQMASIAVVEKDAMGCWNLVESTYKFTKTTVSFDVKFLTKYCVTCAKPDRQKRMETYVPRIEQRVARETGEVLIFTSLARKSWLLIVESVRSHDIERVCRQRQENGFMRLHRKQPIHSEHEIGWKGVHSPAHEEFHKMQELWEGMELEFTLYGGVKFVEGSEKLKLRVFVNMLSNYQCFFIEPSNTDIRELKACMSFVVPHVALPERKGRKSTTRASVTSRLTSASKVSVASTTTPTEPVTCEFDFTLTEEMVKDYLHVPEPEPEVVEEMETTDQPKPLLLAPQKTTLSTKPPRATSFAKPMAQKKVSTEAVDRLARSKHVPMIEKESKVLSGRSLRCLSEIIHEGLTLAVHLALPDSTITGIGFDALASGLDMHEVTYKILLHWKRINMAKKDSAVEQLAIAVGDMGYPVIAGLILERHRDNLELSEECVKMCVQNSRNGYCEADRCYGDLNGRYGGADSRHGDLNGRYGDSSGRYGDKDGAVFGGKNASFANQNGGQSSNGRSNIGGGDVSRGMNGLHQGLAIHGEKHVGFKDSGNLYYQIKNNNGRNGFHAGRNTPVENPNGGESHMQNDSRIQNGSHDGGGGNRHGPLQHRRSMYDKMRDDSENCQSMEIDDENNPDNATRLYMNNSQDDVEMCIKIDGVNGQNGRKVIQGSALCQYENGELYVKRLRQDENNNSR